LLERLCFSLGRSVTAEDAAEVVLHAQSVVEPRWRRPVPTPVAHWTNISANRDAITWHETFILPAGHRFEYLNCARAAG